MLSARGRQRGVALVVGLVMLTVLTLLVVTALRIGILELKIGGVSYGAAQNFANVDLALARFMNDNGGRFQPGCLKVDREDVHTQAFSCFYPSDSAPGDVVITGSNATQYRATYSLHAGRVAVEAQEVSCVTDAARAKGNNLTDTAGRSAPDLFTADARARAEGNIAGLTIVRQGLTRLLAPCACGNC